MDIAGQHPPTYQFNLSDNSTVYEQELGALAIENTITDYSVSINYSKSVEQFQVDNNASFFVLERPESERGSYWLQVDKDLAVPGTYMAYLEVEYIDSESGEVHNFKPIQIIAFIY